MQPTQKLAGAFRNLLALVEEEAERNPAFAERLEAISESLPTASAKRPRRRALAARNEIPDVFTAYQEKGEQEFRFWLRSLNLRLLKSIVKASGFDPGKNSQRWTEPDKFVELVTEQTAARLRRGSAFLVSKTPRNPGEE